MAYCCLTRPRTPPCRGDVGDTPIGESKHPYYNADSWKKYLWKYIVVVNHDFSPKTNQFTSILFEPVDVAARACAAGNTFPGNHVQLEGDYFELNKVDASWEVGHVGVSDYGKKYWLITYQIAKGKHPCVSLNKHDFTFTYHGI